MSNTALEEKIYSHYRIANCAALPPQKTISIKGAIISGIALVSIISWPRNTPVTYFPHNDILGDSRYNFFKDVIAFHKIEKTLNVLEWDVAGTGGQFALGE
jgi:xanthine/uracil/vitamin C permease (AzgA family)